MKAAERSASSGPSRLFGRERELRLLDDALGRPPGVILVTGEAGVGKTRLLAELSARRSTRWLIGQCRPQDPSPVTDALGINSADNQDVLTALSAAGPVVLLIEDLHWATPDTLHLLRFLTSRIPPKAHIVLTSRGDLVSLAGLSPSRTAEVRLEPLDAHAVRDLTAHLLGLDLVPSALTEELIRHSGGLPFAVEEFLRDIPVRQGALIEDRVRRALAETRPPVALRASMALMTQDVSVDCRRVACTAAVLATAVSEALLGAVSEVAGAALTTAIDDALASGLLHEPRPGLYDFKHTLARRAVVAMIPPDELRRLHRQAATALASIEPPPHARIADHARLGGRIKKWLTHAELAADHSVAVGNIEDAVEQLTAMLQIEALTWADRARLATKLGRVAMAGPWAADAITTLRAILAESRIRSVARGRLRLALGLLLHDRAGEVRAGRRELAAAIEELGGDPESAAWAMSTLAVPSFGTEPIYEHRAWMQRALSLIGDTPDADAQIAVRTNQARFRLALGEADEAAGADVASALAWLGKVRQSSALLDQEAENADPYTQAVIAATRLRLAFASGDWSLLPERLARAAVPELPLVHAELMLIDGRLRLARGDVAAGKELLEEVIARTEFGPLPLYAAAVAACPGADVEQCLTDVRRKAAWAMTGDLVLVACRSYLRDGRIDDARRLAREAVGGTLVEGLVNRSPELCRQAAGEYRAMGWHYYESLALEEHGLLLLSQGNPQPLTETAAAYESMGARGDARRCRDAVQAAGFPVVRKRGRRPYGNTLSPRELQVARLAAQGRTNAQIATTLGLSVSTVEDHITRTLRKLNISSRHALADRLA
jgi:DNA-binding CsgD family transcriptional regulator